jgi:hypothetical protein
MPMSLTSGSRALRVGHGLDHGVTRSGQEAARSGAKIRLLDDTKPVAHVAPAAAARTGNSNRNVEP